MSRRRTPGARASLVPGGGFTLLELLVVLALLALGTALAVPALVGQGATELEVAARDVVSALKVARTEALASGRPAALVLDVEAHRMELPGGRRARALPHAVTIEVYTARGEVEEGSRAGIRFFPDGSSTGGRVTLSVAGSRRLVDIDWLTGRVELTRGAPAGGAGVWGGRG